MLQQNILTPAGSAHTTPLGSPLDPQHQVMIAFNQSSQHNEHRSSFQGGQQQHSMQQQEPHPIIQDMINSAPATAPSHQQQQHQQTGMDQQHTTATNTMPTTQLDAHQMAAVAAAAAAAQMDPMLLGQQQHPAPNAIDQNSQHSQDNVTQQQQHPLHPVMTPQQQQSLVTTTGGLVMAAPSQDQQVNHNNATTTMALIQVNTNHSASSSGHKHPMQQDNDHVRKKMRRNTMSSYPTQQTSSTHVSSSITTTNNAPQHVTATPMTFSVAPNSSSNSTTPSACSDDANIRRLTRIQQKRALGTLQLPPPPSPAELWSKIQSAPGRGQSVERAPLSAKEYESMSREELISRLVELEQEKRSGESMSSSPSMSINGGPACSHDTESTSSSTNKPITLTASREVGTIKEEDENAAEDDNPSSTKDEEDEEDDDEEEAVHQEVVCRWKDCGSKFDKLQQLIDHLGDIHVGSGKVNHDALRKIRYSLWIVLANVLL